jgi:hypothetical protein
MCRLRQKNFLQLPYNNWFVNRKSSGSIHFSETGKSRRERTERSENLIERASGFYFSMHCGGLKTENALTLKLF